ncbi:MAG: acyltransferase [Eggerthellaceae bacterium]|jgi:maltose O-acetyltransferase
MTFRNKVLRHCALFLVNRVLKGTHFFEAKRHLLNFAGLSLGPGVKLVGPIEIGTVANLIAERDCWLGKNLKIDGNGTVRLGKNIDIGPQVTFCTGGHEIGPSEHRAGRGIVATQRIGSGCWIGAHSLIVGNTSIGAGCVVAAGAVVLKDSPDDVLLAGIPAVVKKDLE